MEATSTSRVGGLGLAVFFIAAIALLAVTIELNGPTKIVAPATLGLVAIVLAHRALLEWRTIVSSIVLVILFVPMRKYSLPGSLPINLEPYRLLVALVAVLWVAALLVDPHVRLHRSGIVDRPLAAFAVAIVLSLAANKGRFESVSGDTTKVVLFFLSYVLVIYIVASLVRSEADLDFQVKVLVYGGAVVALSCFIERRTHYNVFDHLSQIAPVLRQTAGPTFLLDPRGYRVIGSSQHPIAMGAALVMLVPLALYRAFVFGGKLSWVAAVMITFGALVTISRTAVIMLGVVILVMLVLKPRVFKKAWPALLPALLVLHVAAPGTIGTIQAAFFPAGGLVAQQQNARVGSGRLATLGPALHSEFLPNPMLGEGFGTRVTVPDDVVRTSNGPILDDQWLGILLETGVVGALAFASIFVVFVRRVGGAARADDSPRGWFLAAITASVAAYGVSMFFYDTLSFIQVTFLLFILIGLGSAGYRLRPGAAEPNGRLASSHIAVRPAELKGSSSS